MIGFRTGQVEERQPEPEAEAICSVWTVSDWSKALKVSPGTVKKMLRDKQLPGFQRVPGRSPWFTVPGEVDLFMEGRWLRNQPGSQVSAPEQSADED